MSVMFACHLDLRVLEIILPSSSLVPLEAIPGQKRPAVTKFNPPTHETVLVMDLSSGLGSLLHVLLVCRCVAVCVEHNKGLAEVAQASFPQSVHLEFVLERRDMRWLL